MIVVNANEKRLLSFVHSSSEPVECIVRLVGEGAQVVIDEVFLAGAKSSISVFHESPRTFSRVNSRGVARDKVGSFARIVIPKSSEFCESSVSQKFLLLGGDVDAMPSLEIEACNVKATHACALSEIDEDVLFYLVSRGLSDAEAKKVIIDGFLGVKDES